MQDQHKSKTLIYWCVSIAVNLAVLIAVLRFTEFVYETNDDYAIAGMIVSGYPFVRYVNYFLCIPLIGLQSLLKQINAFVLFQLICSFASFTAVTKTFLSTAGHRFIKLFSVLLIILLSFDHYSMIQFTKTAALLCAAGALLIYDSITGSRPPRTLVFPLFLFFSGTYLRFETALVALCFLAFSLIIHFISHAKQDDGATIKKQLKTTCIVIALLAVMIGSDQVSVIINSGTPELKQFRAFDDLRSRVIDYSILDSYEQNMKEYEEAGFSEDDLRLIDHWYLDYDGAASIENLEKIVEIYENSDAHKPVNRMKSALSAFFREVRSSVRNMNRTGVHIVLLVLIALTGLLLLRPRKWLYIILTGMAVIVFYLYLYYTGRSNYRARYVIDICAMLYILYYYCTPDGCFDLSRGRNKAVYAVSIVILIVFTAFSSLLMVKNSDSMHRCNAENILSDSLAGYIQESEDTLFVFRTYERAPSGRYIHPLSAPVPEKNIVEFGGWDTRSPYEHEKISRFGVNNLFSDIIDKENVRVIDSWNVKRLEAYFNKWYGRDSGKKIIFVETETVDGHVIYKVVTV